MRLSKRGPSMGKPPYEKCHYLIVGQCPYKITIEKALLIPQLLDPAQIVDAKRLCEKCGQILVEKRKAIRVKRPLRVVATRLEHAESFRGSVIDVSSIGVLVRLQDCTGLNTEEKVELQIYSHSKILDKLDTDAITVEGIVKRLAENQNEIAIAFVEKTSVDKVINSGQSSK